MTLEEKVAAPQSRRGSRHGILLTTLSTTYVYCVV